MKRTDILEKTPNNNFIYKIILVISVSFLVIAAFQIVTSQYLLQNGDLAEATLVEYVEKRTNKDRSSSSYAPVYEYINKQNKKIRYESDESSAIRFGNIGDKVTVIYSLETNQTKVNTYWGLYGFSTILLVIAVPLFILSMYYFFFNKV